MLVDLISLGDFFSLQAKLIEVCWCCFNLESLVVTKCELRLARPFYLVSGPAMMVVVLLVAQCVQDTKAHCDSGWLAVVSCV